MVVYGMIDFVLKVIVIDGCVFVEMFLFLIGFLLFGEFKLEFLWDILIVGD